MYDFPGAPNPGDEYTPPVGGQTYIWQPPRWLVKGIPPAGGGGGGGIDEAPVDGEQYARQDASWAQIDIPEGSWDSITGKPATFPPTVPIPWTDVSGKPSTFPPTLPIPWADVSGKPSTYPPLPHGHQQFEVANLVTDLGLKAPLASPGLTGTPTAPTAAPGTNTTQIASTAFVKGAVDANVEDWSTVTGKPSTFPPSTHSHPQSEVTNLVTDLAGKAPTIHTHAQSDVTGLVAGQAAQDTAISGKAPTVHTHAQADVTNLVADLALKAPLESPTFTGDPKAPTPATSDNDTSIATTAYVKANLATITSGAVISDTAPASPQVGQLWFESDTGNTFIWYNDGDSAQWVQQSGSPPRDFMFSTFYDLSYGFRPGKWAWNDKADFTGSDVMALTETGDLSVATGVTTGAVSATGNVNVGGGLGVTGAASVGTTLDVTGRITGYGDVRSISGRFIGTEGAGLILSTATGNTAGTIWLRPNGVSNVAGEATIISSGVFTAAGMTCSGAFNCIGTIYGHHAYQCKAGTAGGFGANTFNYNWETSAMRMWVDNTAVGMIAFSSDYRIKKDVADLPSTWEAVKALRPVKYTPADFQPPMSDATKAAVLKKAVEDHARSQGVEPDEVNTKDLPKEEPNPPLFQGSDVEHWSLIAHEVQEALIPSAADGVKDMEDGVQSLNQNAIIAALTKALQEAMTRIEALEAANGL